MREVSIRGLRANLARELSDLPFLIVKSGVVVAVCTQGGLEVCTQEREGAVCVHKPKKSNPVDEDVKEWGGGFSKARQLGKRETGG